MESSSCCPTDSPDKQSLGLTGLRLQPGFDFVVSLVLGLLEGGVDLDGGYPDDIAFGQKSGSEFGAGSLQVLITKDGFQ